MGIMRLDVEERRAELHWRSIFEADLAHNAHLFRGDLVHELHSFDDAKRLVSGDLVAHLDEGRARQEQVLRRTCPP